MEVTFPVVQMDQDKFEEYETLYNSTNGNITLIIDDEGRNEWVDVRTSGWFIFFGISLGLFELVNLSCAVWVLSGHWPFQKSLVTVCLFLEIGANILRLLFLVDPWSGFVDLQMVFRAEVALTFSLIQMELWPVPVA
jgi:hypothetical protein